MEEFNFFFAMILKVGKEHSLEFLKNKKKAFAVFPFGLFWFEHFLKFNSL